MGSESEEQGQYSASLVECSQTVNNECETMSPEIPMASSSCVGDDQEDKDDSWMQFIIDDAWCSNTAIGGVN